MNLPGGEKATFDDFFRCINLCHDCIALKDTRKGHEGKYSYNGPSVDEVCLLEMCRDTGLGRFITRDSEKVSIEVDGQVEEYVLIKIFPFTSERKAMSVVL